MSAAATADGSRPLGAEEFREVVGHFASGVTVITTSLAGEPLGATASAFTSLSLDPPMVVVCLNRSSDTGQAVLESGRLAVNILGEDHAELAVHFARHGTDKFGEVDLRPGAHGQPLLADALASLVCRVTEHVVAATHFVFLARVDEATARPGSPLAYYRGRFGRLELAEHQGLLREVRDFLLAGGEEGEALAADVYAARAAIEVGVARQTVGKVSAAELRPLREAMEATAPLVDGDRFLDLAAWVEANARFHEAFVALAGSEVLASMHRSLGTPALERLILHDLDADPGLVEDHRRLVEAYERGDVDAACAAIADHAERPRRLATHHETTHEEG